MADLEHVASRLAQASIKSYRSPYDAVVWPPALERDTWFFSPELISIAATKHYLNLSPAQCHVLSFWETVNFFSLNIAGEKPLIEGLTQRLYRQRGGALPPAIEAYLHHFLDEENKHMVYFGGFCRRYANTIYPDKKIAFPRDYAPGEEDFLFFAKVMIFEEIVDSYNVTMAKDDRLHPLVRTINDLHHQDENRHLAFGRLCVRELYEKYAPAWNDLTLAGIRQNLAAYLHSTWREYYNPSVYIDAGIGGDPYRLMDEAWAHPNALARRNALSERAMQVLVELDLAMEVH